MNGEEGAMVTRTKKAIDVSRGDYIVGQWEALSGTVDRVIVIDRGVQIMFNDGGYIVRAEDDLVVVRDRV